MTETRLPSYLYKFSNYSFLIHHRFFVAQATPSSVDFQKIEAAAKQEKSDNFGLELGNKSRFFSILTD